MGCVSTLDRENHTKKAEKQDYGKVGETISITVYSLDRGKVWKITKEVTRFRKNNMIDIIWILSKYCPATISLFLNGLVFLCEIFISRTSMTV